MKNNLSLQYHSNKLIDVSDKLIESYKDIPANEMKRMAEKPTEELPPQAAEMFAYMSAHVAHEIDKYSRHYHDYSHAVNCLALANCLVACELSNIEPSFESPTLPDPYVKSTFTYQMMGELNREQYARISEGLWRVFYDTIEDCMHVCLSRRRRLSALGMLDAEAKKECLEHMSDQTLDSVSMDELYYIMASSKESLAYVMKADPVGWAKFEDAAGFSAQELAAFHGFIVFLDFAADYVGHSFWYDEVKLKTLCDIYCQGFPEHNVLAGDALIRLMEAFSLPPSRAANDLILVPFYILHGKFLRSRSFIRYHDSILGMLTIAVRKNENVWNNTLGSTLARAADVVGSSLPTFSRLKVAARRKFPGGDIDLALYDTVSKHMFVCEVKTVYDKHRVDSLMHRFESAKVNISKAVSQLRATESAMNEGVVSMQSIFGENMPQPKKVHFVLLTWLDVIDLTMAGCDEDIISLNFASIKFLANAAKGDLEMIARSIYELRNIWSVAAVRPLDLGQPELKSDLEIQIGIIDSRDDLEELDLSSLTLELLNKLPSISDLTSEDEATEFVSYMEDTKSALSITI